MVTTYDSFESLSAILREAVVDLLYRMADDDLLIGRCESEWTDLAPSPQEAAVFSTMARDETAHARKYYEILHELGQAEPYTLAFHRGPRRFRCASLACLPRRDWAFAVTRQFLYEAHESVRLTALSESALTPLAGLARDLRTTEMGHLIQARSWVLRLGRSNAHDRGKLQEALSYLYPHALGLFEPTEADEPLAQAGICPREGQLRREWESAAAPALAAAGLTAPENVEPAYGGRVGRQPETLRVLLEDLQTAHKTDMP